MTQYADLLNYLLTAIGGGGLGWIVTLKYQKKNAEADAMKNMQEVYNRMISDLKSDRSDLKETIKDLNAQIKNLEDKTDSHSRQIAQMKPLLCTDINCPKRCRPEELQH